MELDPENIYLASRSKPFSWQSGKKVNRIQIATYHAHYLIVKNTFLISFQHRCVAIFKDKKNMPTGFALGSIEGRCAIQFVQAANP